MLRASAPYPVYRLWYLRFIIAALVLLIVAIVGKYILVLEYNRNLNGKKTITSELTNGNNNKSISHLEMKGLP